MGTAWERHGMCESAFTGRVTLAGQVEGDGPDERGYPGPPGWGLGVRLTTSPRKKNLFVMKTYNKPRNVMNKIRWRQKTGITDLTFGTWHVQTMLQPGKMMEIADKVLKLGIDLVALQESRWQGHGEIN
jgi:hypothetical protein